MHHHHLHQKKKRKEKNSKSASKYISEEKSCDKPTALLVLSTLLQSFFIQAIALQNTSSVKTWSKVENYTILKMSPDAERERLTMLKLEKSKICSQARNNEAHKLKSDDTITLRLVDQKRQCLF